MILIMKLQEIVFNIREKEEGREKRDNSRVYK
jgi:hypothetical protein